MFPVVPRCLREVILVSFRMPGAAHVAARASVTPIADGVTDSATHGV